MSEQQSGAAANLQILLQTNNDLMIAIHKALVDNTHETLRKIESLRDDVRDIKLNLQKNDNTLKEEATNWRSHTELLLKEQGDRHNQDISRLMDMLMKLVLPMTAPTMVTAPAPIVTAPTMVTAPAPIVTAPAPIVTAPAPIVTAPTPIVTAPVSIVTAPASIVTAPNKFMTGAVSFGIAPTPIVTAPASIVTAPNKFMTDDVSLGTAPAPIVTAPAPIVTAPNTFMTAAISFGTGQAPVVTAPQQVPTQITNTFGGGTIGGSLFGGGAKGGNTSFADLAKKSGETAGGGGLFGGGFKPQFGSSPFSSAAAQAQNFKFFSPPKTSLNGSVLSSKGADENRGEEESDKEDETAEDYTPDVHYEPVIELPPEVEVVSGEENEEVLFQARCKLYRYDREAKENKERGLGDIKILKNVNTQKYRCVMRREKVLKLCVNFPIVGELKLHKREQMPTVYTWACKDFSEDTINGQDETFSVRFKDVSIANEFNEKMTEAVEHMKNQ